MRTNITEKREKYRRLLELPETVLWPRMKAFLRHRQR
jgi:hypothetical protein